MNLYDATRMVHAGTQLGDVFLVKLLTQIQELFWVDSGLSDWESEDDVLMDVCAASVASETHLRRHLALTLRTMFAWIPLDISSQARS